MTFRSKRGLTDSSGRVFRFTALAGAFACLGFETRISLGEPGLTALTFLRRPMDARATGMGGSFSALGDHLGGIQFNPAGISGLADRTVLATLLPGLNGDQSGFIAYGHPLSGRGVLAAGFQYYNAGPMTLNLSNGVRGSVTAGEDMAASVSYARRVLPGLGLGTSFKHARSSLAGVAHATASLWDIGAVWESPLSGLSLGAAAQNIGSDIRYESSGDPPPRTLRYGAAYLSPTFFAHRLDPSVKPTRADFILSLDAVETLSEAPSPRLGLELGLEPPFIRRIALRFGWASNRGNQSASMGFGLREGRYSMDYAFGPGGGDFNSHMFSVSARF